MTMRNWLNENIILPFSDLILDQSISKDLKFLMTSQWWTREQIDEFQNFNLPKLIKHSYENVPFYSELFKKLKLTPNDIKSKNDLYKIPILTKEDIRKNFPEKIIARNLLKSQFILESSSGSTGQPLNFYKSKISMSFNKASAIRSWYWMDYKLGDKYVKISSYPRNPVKKFQDILNNSRYLNSVHLTKEIFGGMIEKIELFDPKIIRSYPLLLDYLSQLIEKRGGIKLNNLKAINTTGSTLHPYMRKKIQEIFKVNIYDSYSCEGSSVFAQCELLDNYHPSEEYAISEFIEDDFSRNDQDKAKRHVTTDLFNYATPFIRYDTQDYLVLGDDNKCNCGRNYLNISKIKGRDGDILVLPSGKYLIGQELVNILGTFTFIDQFQVYQEKSNLIRMRLVVNNLFNEIRKKEIYDYWKNYLGNDVEFLLEIVAKIESLPNGKRRFVIRNPEIKIS